MKILALGESGLVGTGFSQVTKNSFEIIAPTLDEIDVLNRDQLFTAIKNSAASTIINFVGFTAVDKAEEEAENKNGLAYQLNVVAAANLAQLCKQERRHLIHISTAFVFDGTQKDRPYTENDSPNPLNWYGQTKYLGEQAIINSGCRYAIARIDMPYCCNYPLKSDFFRFFLEKMKKGETVKAINDQKVTPIYIPDLAEALRQLILQKAEGIYHIAPPKETTPFRFAKMVADKFGFDASLVDSVTFEEISIGRKAIRPICSWMDSSKFSKLFGNNILHTSEETLDLLKKELA